MKTFKESLGLKIKEYRKSRGFTQEKLAEIIDVNQRQLTRIESGENFPSAETLEKICIAIDVEPKYFFDFEWQVREELLKTGTDSRPVLRLIQKNEVVTVKSSSPAITKEFKTGKQFPANQSEKSMIECARKIKQPVKVEYFNGKDRSEVKIYYPDGTVESILNQKDADTYKTYEKLLEKIKNASSDINRLEFILKAVEALENQDALRELQYLIKGIELSHR